MPNFMSIYLEYTSSNEAPTLFHKWTAITIVGAALSRKVFLNKDYYKVYPTHFTILVAPSGRCRKSVATGIGINLLRNIEDINIIAEKITPEALINALHIVKKGKDKKSFVDSAGLIYAPELAVFIGRQKYNEGLVAMLTTLSDSPDEWSYRTKASGTVKLQNVSLSLLGASTADWIVEALPASVFGGGFMSRCIFVSQEDTPRSFPFPQIPVTNHKELLIEKLRRYSEISGQFIFTQEAKKFYEDWYHYNKNIYIEDRKLAGYFERKPDHLIRLAMVLSVMSDSNELIINKTIVENSLEQLNELEAFLPDAFAEMEVSLAGRDQSRILRMLARAPNKASTHGNLMKLNYRYMSRNRFVECINTLIDAELVIITSTKPTTYKLNLPDGRKGSK